MYVGDDDKAERGGGTIGSYSTGIALIICLGFCLSQSGKLSVYLHLHFPDFTFELTLS